MRLPVEFSVVCFVLFLFGNVVIVLLLVSLFLVSKSRLNVFQNPDWVMQKINENVCSHLRKGLYFPLLVALMTTQKLKATPKSVVCAHNNYSKKSYSMIAFVSTQITNKQTNK